MHHQFLFQYLLVSYFSIISSYFSIYQFLFVSIIIAGPHQVPPLTALPTAVHHVSYSPAPAPGPGEAAIPGGSNVSPANEPAGNTAQAPVVDQLGHILLYILCMVLSLRM
jgi:hypothetical protein